MREIGARIYYDKLTGEVILHIGERKGMVSETTLTQDVRAYKVLFERNSKTYDFIDLEYGQFRQDFQKSNGYRVNPETNELEFSYPLPNEEEPVYKLPMSTEIDELKKENTLLKAQNQANSDRADFHEEVLTEIILAINP